MMLGVRITKFRVVLKHVLSLVSYHNSEVPENVVIMSTHQCMML